MQFSLKSLSTFVHVIQQDSVQVSSILTFPGLSGWAVGALVSVPTSAAFHTLLQTQPIRSAYVSVFLRLRLSIFLTLVEHSIF